MKKYLCVLMVVCLLMSLAACAKIDANNTQESEFGNEMPYSIHVENGEYFLVFKDHFEVAESDETDEQKLARSIRFETIEEMKNDFETGNFSERELEIISEWREEDEEKVQICNLSSLYTARCPSDLTVSSIGWYGGDGYLITMRADADGPKALMSYGVTPEYNEERIELYSNYEENPRITVKAVSFDLERNATIYEYITSVIEREYKLIVYSIGEGTEMLYVVETYDVMSNDEVPSSIEIYGQEQGKYFRLDITNLQERPSVEWLSQFGLKEYAETEVA